MVKKQIHLLVCCMLLVGLCVALLSACTEHAKSDSNSIIGTWEASQISILGVESSDGESEDEFCQQYQFNEDLTGTIILTVFGNRTETPFTYTLSETDDGAEVSLTYEGTTQTFTYHIEGDTLTLSRGARTGEWKRV